MDREGAHQGQEDKRKAQHVRLRTERSAWLAQQLPNCSLGIHILMSAWGVFTELFSANVHAQIVLLSAAEQKLIWKTPTLFLLESLSFHQRVYLEQHKKNFSRSCASAPDCPGCVQGVETQILILSLSLFLSQGSYLSI